MAVNEHLLGTLRSTLDDYFMHQLNYFDRYFVGWSLQVFPIGVIVLNSIVHKHFWIISEAYFGYYAFSTVGVLTWFFQVENGSDTLLLEL